MNTNLFMYFERVCPLIVDFYILLPKLATSRAVSKNIFGVDLVNLSF